MPHPDGRKFCIGHWMKSVPARELCTSGIAETQQLRFSGLASGCSYKALLDARTVKEIDLGGHSGGSLPPFSKAEVAFSNLGIFHLHDRCIESEVASSRQACIRHGYMNEDDTKIQALQKLQTLYKGNLCGAARHGIPFFYEKKKTWFSGMLGEKKKGCGMASCHKVSFYGSYLACPNETTDDFYRLGENPSVGPNEKFASFLKAAVEMFAFD